MGLALVLLAGLCAPAPGDAAPARRLVLATTTSVRDSGLLDALLPPFREATGIRVEVVAVGSGAALRMAASGDADVVIAHAPDLERQWMRKGKLIDRRPFMENYFVLAGPPEDPAHVREAASVVEAIRRIARRELPYVSRGDQSGTDQRELLLFERAGVDREAGWPALVRTGAGMGLTLQVAGEKRAYVLSDVGTFRAFRERVGLVALSRPEPLLRNVYSVLRPNPKGFPPGRLAVAAAKRFADYLLEPVTQERIARYRRGRESEPLFIPLAATPAGASRAGAAR